MPKDGKPVTNWTNRDDAFFDITAGIRKAVKELANNIEASSPVKEPRILPILPANQSSKPQTSPTQEAKRPLLDVEMAQSQDTKTQSAKDRLTILIVEDDVDIVEVMKAGLKYEIEALHIEAAYDGLEGLAAAQRINPDLIILDLMLPGIDGLEVCSRLRSNPTTCDIPILMLTTKSDVRDWVTGLRAGADDYMAKPFVFDELVERIFAIMRRQSRGKPGSSKSDYV